MIKFFQLLLFFFAGTAASAGNFPVKEVFDLNSGIPLDPTLAPELREIRDRYAAAGNTHSAHQANGLLWMAGGEEPFLWLSARHLKTGEAAGTVSQVYSALIRNKESSPRVQKALQNLKEKNPALGGNSPIDEWGARLMPPLDPGLGLELRKIRDRDLEAGNTLCAHQANWLLLFVEADEPTVWLLKRYVLAGEGMKAAVARYRSAKLNKGNSPEVTEALEALEVKHPGQLTHFKLFETLGNMSAFNARIRIYKADHEGAFPDSVEDILPGHGQKVLYLPEVPLEHFTGTTRCSSVFDGKGGWYFDPEAKWVRPNLAFDGPDDQIAKKYFDREWPSKEP